MARGQGHADATKRWVQRVKAHSERQVAAGKRPRHRRRWTTEERATLIREWHQGAIDYLLKKLPGRSELAINDMARELELDFGQPAGTLSMKGLVRHLGVSEALLRRVLVWAQVPIKSFNYRTVKSLRRKRRLAIEVDAAEEALRVFDNETDTINRFCDQHHVKPERFRAVLAAMPHPPSPALRLGAAGGVTRYWSCCLQSVLRQLRPLDGHGLRSAAAALDVPVHRLQRAVAAVGARRSQKELKPLAWWRGHLEEARARALCLPLDERVALSKANARGRARDRLRALLRASKRVPA